MLIGSVVDGQVQNDLHVALVAEIDQFNQILFLAKAPVKLVIILGVVLVIGGRGEDGREPQPLHAQALARIDVAVVEVIQPVDDTANISDTVAVGVRERSNEDLVVGSAVVVDRVNHGLSLLLLASRKDGKSQQHHKSQQKRCDFLCSFHNSCYSLMELKRASSILPQALGPEHLT